MSMKSERTSPVAGGPNPLDRYRLNAFVQNEAIEVRTMGPRSDLMSGGTPDDYRALVSILERETARIKSDIVADALAGKLGDVRALTGDATRSGHPVRREAAAMGCPENISGSTALTPRRMFTNCSPR